MKVLVRPVVDPQAEIDLTHRLVSAIAEELWKLYGGNEQLNWLEAELHLQRIVGQARDEAAETTFVSVAESAWADGSGQLQDGQSSEEEPSRERSGGLVCTSVGGRMPPRSFTKANGLLPPSAELAAKDLRQGAIR